MYLRRRKRQLCNMFQSLTFLHSIFRWLVLLSLICSIYKAYSGYILSAKFSKADHLLRHWTATIAHIQLMLGISLYFQSPMVKYYLKNFNTNTSFDLWFFGLIHSFLMVFSIVIITIGSALAKRKLTDREKFKTMLLWFSVALIVIFIAIPWPFSPFSNRPYFR